MADLDVLIPITFFFSVAYAIKVVADARVRAKLVASNTSEELIRTMLLGEEAQRRHASLRWGVVLLCLAGGFGVIQVIGWDYVTPGVIGVLLAATGIGNLAFYAIARSYPQGRPALDGPPRTML